MQDQLATSSIVKVPSSVCCAPGLNLIVVVPMAIHYCCVAFGVVSPCVPWPHGLWAFWSKGVIVLPQLMDQLLSFLECD